MSRKSTWQSIISVHATIAYALRNTEPLPRKVKRMEHPGNQTSIYLQDARHLFRGFIYPQEEEAQEMFFSPPKRACIARTIPTTGRAESKESRKEAVRPSLTYFRRGIYGHVVIESSRSVLLPRSDGCSCARVASSLWKPHLRILMRSDTSFFCVKIARWIASVVDLYNQRPLLCQAKGL